jgi:hypothetical protein
VGVLICCLAPKCCKCCNYRRWLRWLFGWARKKRRLALEWTPELEEDYNDDDASNCEVEVLEVKKEGLEVEVLDIEVL